MKIEKKTTWGAIIGISAVAIVVLSLLFTGILGGNPANKPQNSVENNSTNLTEPSDKVVVYFFWGKGCPHCAKEKPFLEKLEQKYPELEIKMYEIYRNQENAKLFQQVAKAYGIQARGVPATFIGDFEPIVGYGSDSTTGKLIEDKVEHCIEKGCPSPADKLNGEG